MLILFSLVFHFIRLSGVTEAVFSPQGVSRPTIQSLKPKSLGVNVGSTVTFQCIFITHISNLTVKQVDLDDAGGYICLVGNPAGFVYDTAVLYVNSVSPQTSIFIPKIKNDDNTILNETIKRFDNLTNPVTQKGTSTQPTEKRSHPRLSTPSAENVLRRKSKHEERIVDLPDDIGVFRHRGLWPIYLTLLSDKVLTAHVGDTVEMVCRVDNPYKQKIVYNWMRQAPTNGQSDNQQYMIIHNRTYVQPYTPKENVFNTSLELSYVVDDARVEDVGQYACVIYAPGVTMYRLTYLLVLPKLNKGQVSTSSVLTNSQRSTESTTHQLPNTTLSSFVDVTIMGSNITFSELGAKKELICRIYNSKKLKLTATWVKKLDELLDTDLRQIRLDGHRYSLVKENSEVEITDSIDLALVVDVVQSTDSGMYACLVKDENDMLYRFVTLKLLDSNSSDSPISGTTSQTSVATMSSSTADHSMPRLRIMLKRVTESSINVNVGASINISCLPSNPTRKQLYFVWMKLLETRQKSPYSGTSLYLGRDLYYNISTAVLVTNTTDNVRTLSIDYATWRHTGTYACALLSAKRRRYQITTVLVPDTRRGRGPMNLPLYPHNVKIGRINRAISIECRFKSTTVPNITWFRELGGLITKKLGSFSTTVIGDNVYSRTFVIPSAHVEDQGFYVCIGETQAGYTENRIKLLVLSKGTIGNALDAIKSEKNKKVFTFDVIPRIIQTSVGDWDGYIRSSGYLTLICKAVGKSKPKVSWHYNNHIIPLRKFTAGTESTKQLYHIFSRRRNGVLQIKNGSPNDSGVYTCIAENNMGRTTHTYDVLFEKPNNDQA